jgi:5-methylthioribose kinase
VTSYSSLTTETVVRFVNQWRPELDASGANEISDGNLNLVFRVNTAAGTGSVIVKQAVPYLRVAGEGWPLTLDRSRIEAEALELHGGLAPGLTPQVMHRDDDMHVLVLEDLSGHQVWRQALVAGEHISGAAAGVGFYCARTLLGSSNFLMKSDERRALVARFDNPELCAITEDLVFTAPYIDAASNDIDEAAVEVAELLRRDRALQQAAARLRFIFRSRGEAVIHGDLHTGSIMVAPNDPRVMDPEFAFSGPMAFDVGNVLANFAFARIRHHTLGNAVFARQVDLYAQEFWSAFTDEVATLWPSTEPWMAPFLQSLLVDAAGFGAMEMIRRMVGLAHVRDIDELPLDLRYKARKTVLEGARALALGLPVASLDDLWGRAIGKEA